MAAQIMTPILSGFLLEHVSYRTGCHQQHTAHNRLFPAKAPRYLSNGNIAYNCRHRGYHQTPNRLRSRANAVINLLGAVGGVYSLIMIKLLVGNGSRPDYEPLFISVAAATPVTVSPR